MIVRLNERSETPSSDGEPLSRGERVWGEGNVGNTGVQRPESLRPRERCPVRAGHDESAPGRERFVSAGNGTIIEPFLRTSRLFIYLEFR